MNCAGEATGYPTLFGSVAIGRVQLVPALRIEHVSLNRSTSMLRLEDVVCTSTYAVALHVFEYRYLFCVLILADTPLKERASLTSRV
jgi:hypothetical protein